MGHRTRQGRPSPANDEVLAAVVKRFQATVTSLSQINELRSQLEAAGFDGVGICFERMATGKIDTFVTYVTGPADGAASSEGNR
ncbi:hypothetical protein [Brevundimonas diminuta]|uniref:hypothetical protein n=1 Tax=Brevundimonas diminuta TaxID=293 RepID=UPI003CFE96D7